MLFSSTSDILRVLLVAPLAYAALIVFLRISGKRMLSKMSAFDLVVTVALGSTLATIVVSKQVSLLEGLTALATLLALQFIAAWSSSRSAAISRVLKSEPALVFYDGTYLAAALRRENVPAEAVTAGMRQKGFSRVEDVHAVVLEADGSLSVIGHPESATATPASRARLWTGRTLSTLAVLFLTLDGIMKLAKPAEVVQGTVQLGYPETTITGMGIALLVSTLLYVVPRTSLLGAVFLTGFLGGAVATHVRVGNPWLSHTLFPIYIALLIWAGLCLRRPRLAALCLGR